MPDVPGDIHDTIALLQGIHDDLSTYFGANAGSFSDLENMNITTSLSSLETQIGNLNAVLIVQSANNLNADTAALKSATQTFKNGTDALTAAQGRIAGALTFVTNALKAVGSLAKGDIAGAAQAALGN